MKKLGEIKYGSTLYAVRHGFIYYQAYRGIVGPPIKEVKVTDTWGGWNRGSITITTSADEHEQLNIWGTINNETKISGKSHMYFVNRHEALEFVKSKINLFRCRLDTLEIYGTNVL